MKCVFVLFAAVLFFCSLHTCAKSENIQKVGLLKLNMHSNNVIEAFPAAEDAASVTGSVTGGTFTGIFSGTLTSGTFTGGGSCDLAVIEGSSGTMTGKITVTVDGTTISGTVADGTFNPIPTTASAVTGSCTITGGTGTLPVTFAVINGAVIVHSASLSGGTGIFSVTGGTFTGDVKGTVDSTVNGKSTCTLTPTTGATGTLAGTVTVTVDNGDVTGTVTNGAFTSTAPAAGGTVTATCDLASTQDSTLTGIVTVTHTATASNILTGKITGTVTGVGQKAVEKPAPGTTSTDNINPSSGAQTPADGTSEDKISTTTSTAAPTDASPQSTEKPTNPTEGKTDSSNSHVASHIALFIGTIALLSVV